jgi:hypothetical protein
MKVEHLIYLRIQEERRSLVKELYMHKILRRANIVSRWENKYLDKLK